MSAFEFLFTFYGLLLGIALSNVAVGFGKLWRLKVDVAIGWLTPTMSICVIAMVSSLWLGAWASHTADLPISALTLSLALGVALPIIFVSVVLFPDDGDAVGALDEHYLAHRRAIVGALAASSSISLVTPLILGLIPPGAAFQEYALSVAPMIVIPFGLLFIAHRRLHLLGLIALALYRAWFLFR